MLTLIPLLGFITVIRAGAADGEYAGYCNYGRSACIVQNNICNSGLLVNPRCSAYHQTPYGDQCAVDQQCPYGIRCIGDICGGLGACSPDDKSIPNNGVGPSKHCTNSQFCVSNKCTSPYVVGTACTGNYQCGAGAQCTDGECGGDGSACTASSIYPGYDGGPSTQCSSNYCANSICGEDPVSSRCTRDEQCDTRGCGTDGICGGEGATCAPDDFSPDITGYSTLCQSQSCYNGKCRSGSIGVGGSCSDTDVCSTDLHCIEGTCSNEKPSNDGDSCIEDRYCTGGTRCLDDVCTFPNQNKPGQSCVVSDQCSAGLECDSGICGGTGACSPDDTTITSGSGPSSQCSGSDRCINNRCAQPFMLGDICIDPYQCGTNTCSSGQCGGYGAVCTPDTLDTPDSGPSAQCFSEYCLVGHCEDKPYGSCTTDDNCRADGSYCGTDGQCGGLNAVCYPAQDSPDHNGYSPICNAGKSCYYGKCQEEGTIGIGGTCSATQLCQPRLFCLEGSCTNVRPANTGDYCTDPSQCYGGTFCYDSECTAPLAIGATCDSSSQCADSECSDGQCGGNGATCSPQGASTGCVSGYCDGSVCGADPNPPCSASNPCSSPFSCGMDGVCGGTGALCAPDEFSPDNSGYSTLCQPAKSCYNGQCRQDGSLNVGDTCSADQLCQPQFHCIDGKCSASKPANIGSYCTDDSGCTGSTKCVDSECVSTLPGQSDKPIQRRDNQLAWIRAKCPRSGEIACPVANSGTAAYEVGASN